jgi:hypothetical protein
VSVFPAQVVRWMVWSRSSSRRLAYDHPRVLRDFVYYAFAPRSNAAHNLHLRHYCSNSRSYRQHGRSYFQRPKPKSHRTHLSIWYRLPLPYAILSGQLYIYFRTIPAADFGSLPSHCCGSYPCCVGPSSSSIRQVARILGGRNAIRDQSWIEI